MYLEIKIEDNIMRKYFFSLLALAFILSLLFSCNIYSDLNNHTPAYNAPQNQDDYLQVLSSDCAIETNIIQDNIWDINKIKIPFNINFTNLSNCKDHFNNISIYYIISTRNNLIWNDVLKKKDNTYSLVIDDASFKIICDYNISQIESKHNIKFNSIQAVQDFFDINYFYAIIVPSKNNSNVIENYENNWIKFNSIPMEKEYYFEKWDLSNEEGSSDIESASVITKDNWYQNTIDNNNSTYYLFPKKNESEKYRLYFKDYQYLNDNKNSIEIVIYQNGNITNTFYSSNFSKFGFILDHCTNDVYIEFRKPEMNHSDPGISPDPEKQDKSYGFGIEGPVTDIANIIN